MKAAFINYNVFIFTYLGVLFLTPATNSYAQSQAKEKDKYFITGNVAGISGKLYLTIADKRTPIRIDSTHAVNGKFTFSGRVDAPVLAQIESNSRTYISPFFLENSKILVYGDLNKPKNINIYGSTTNNRYMEYKKRIDNVIREVKDNPSKRVDVLIEINRITTDFIDRNTDCVAAAYLLCRELSYNMPVRVLKYKMMNFSTEVQQSIYIKELKEQLKQYDATSTGHKFIDLSLPTPSGDEISISSILNTGKYVLVEFWASWCEPCRRDHPLLKSLYDRFSPMGLEIYSVSLDRRRDEWVRAIREDRLNWIHVSNLSFWNCPGVSSYGIKAVPTNILIAPNGTIIARDIRGNRLVEQLNKIFLKFN